MSRQLSASASFSPVTVTVLQSRYQLTDESCARLRLLTDDFFQSRTRIQVELAFITVQLQHMRELLGEHFQHYAQHTLSLSPATIRRYQGAYRAIVRLYPDGQIDLSKINGISINTLNLLMRHDSDDIIEEVRTAIESNQQVSVDDLRTLIAQRESQTSEELDLVRMELEATLAKAEESRLDYEQQILYLGAELANTTARARNATHELQEANEEILRLCTREPPTVEKVVQMLPEGFLNAHQAVVATEATLRRLEESKTEVEAEIAGLTGQLATLKAQMQAEHHATDQLDAIDAAVATIEQRLDAILSDKGKKASFARLPGVAARLSKLAKRVKDATP